MILDAKGNISVQNLVLKTNVLCVLKFLTEFSWIGSGNACLNERRDHILLTGGLRVCESGVGN